MKRNGWIIAAVATLAISNLNAGSVEDMGKVFQKRCANCHGVKAHGVPKLEQTEGTEHDEANAMGMMSHEAKNIYGPSLTDLTKRELLEKLFNYRNNDFDAEDLHSDMRKTLAEIEKREGKIHVQGMAEYIYRNFHDED